MMVAGRILRDVKALILYPLWSLSGGGGADNHCYKKTRVRRVGARFSCNTFIETGTFYGQMTNAVKDDFNQILSVELYEPLYALNVKAFRDDDRVHIYHGSSQEKLPEMLEVAVGRILFWLDGHYSGVGTALGQEVSPILAELDIVSRHKRKDHCILIDDVRLFTGNGGYPSLDVVKKRLMSINPAYSLVIDRDCLMALP